MEMTFRYDKSLCVRSVSTIMEMSLHRILIILQAYFVFHKWYNNYNDYKITDLMFEDCRSNHTNGIIFVRHQVFSPSATIKAFYVLACTSVRCKRAYFAKK